MNGIKYKITTKPEADGKIIQEIEFNCGAFTEKLVKEVLDTKEAQIRQALIRLGWTPPPFDMFTEERKEIIDE